MKKVILLLSFMPLTVFCQISENFENGAASEWIQFPSDRWAVDNTSAISGSFSLHHNYDNADAGNDQAAIPLLNLRPASGTTRWSFMVRHGYEPSSSNSWAVFLTADNGPEEMHPGGNINGYAIGVNLSGYDDTLRLWKVKQGNTIPVLPVKVNWQNSIGTSSPAKIEVERSLSGEWKIEVRNQSGLIIGSSSGTDPEIFNISWFGIYYKYSSTRDRLLWLDDISINGIFQADILPPVVTKLTVTGKNTIEITFSEEPADGFEDLSNFTINNKGTGAESITRVNPYTFLVSFGDQFTNKSSNTLTLKMVCDNFLNCDDNISISFTPVWAEPGDIVISEIMADPLPPVGLPPAEYLELKNNTGYTFDLTKWKIISDGQPAIFPAAGIAPGESLIICYQADASMFSEYGRVTGLKSFPVLTDAGRWIVITDSTGAMIHGVEYTKDWYGDVLKSEGGWSLEMADVSHPFNTYKNWRASASRNGGTPGKINSVNGTNPDRSFMGIKNVFPQDTISVLVEFSEPVMNYSDRAEKTTIGGYTIKSVIPADLLFRKFLIQTERPLAPGKIYTLCIPAIVVDYSGNVIEKPIARFGLPEIAGRGDIVFNELMFNPLPGLPDYIEFANNSGKIIDVSQLMLISVDDETGDTSTLVSVSTEARCFLPGELYAITTDREAILNRYTTAADTNIYEVSQLPSMPDDGGHLVLLNRQLDLIDEVRYSDKMHYSLLSETEGISLEKVFPGSNPADAGSWHSASETTGWGTPGSLNSIFTNIPAEDDKMEFSSGRISPDNDGYEDQLVMEFSLNGFDNILTIGIFDEGGNQVRKLAENLFAGNQTTITWDGTSDDGSIVATGIYIVFVTVFDDKGKVQKWKRVCTVIR